MTSNDKFEQWWATHEVECIPAHALSQVEYELFKNAARTAWNARLSDEDAETCIAALGFVEEEGPSLSGREHCAAVRRRLESLK